MTDAAAQVRRPRAATPISATRSRSARALLLVTLGEFVWPTGAPVWSSSLIEALADLDIESNAVRKALQRTSEAGLTETERDGRRARWLITPKGDAVMAAGRARTFDWGRDQREWDGRWLLLSVTVPETQRKVRHHLQSRLSWAGMGSPVPGQWLTTHCERVDEIAAIVRDLGLEEQAHAVMGEMAPFGDEERLVHAAWDLDELHADYQRFIDAYAELSPTSDAACFAARITMVQDWRRCSYLDPNLPRRFLTQAWPGFEAARVFHDRHREWVAGSQRHWDRIVGC